jgi:hypothetical protein
MNKQGYLVGYLQKVAWDVPEPTKPYMYNDLTKYIMNGRTYAMPYVKGELDEFEEEWNNKNKAGIEEELEDTMYGLQMMAGSRLKKNIPIVGADNKIQVFINRIKAFNEMFREHGVKFHVDYLAGGSNFKKPEKIVQAFKLAGKDIDINEAARLSQEYQKVYKA